jgi:hypothetical protein
MLSSGTLCRVALVRIYVSEELSVSFIKAEKLPVLQLIFTAKVAPISLILFNLMMTVIRSTEASVLIRATRRHIPEGGIFHMS